DRTLSVRLFPGGRHAGRSASNLSKRAKAAKVGGLAAQMKKLAARRDIAAVLGRSRFAMRSARHPKGDGYRRRPAGGRTSPVNNLCTNRWPSSHFVHSFLCTVGPLPGRSSARSVNLSQIRIALAQAGVRPAKKLGQNFLHDQNLARWIVQ